MTLCAICQDPCDGNYHHIACSSRWHREWCILNHVPYTDATASQFSWEWLPRLSLMPTIHAALSWKGVTLKSHPIQKQIFNAGLPYLKKNQLDPLKRVQAFLDEVKWVTDKDIDPCIVQVFYKRKEAMRIGNVSPYFGSKNNSGEWAQQHPITEWPLTTRKGRHTQDPKAP